MTVLVFCLSHHLTWLASIRAFQFRRIISISFDSAVCTQSKVPLIFKALHICYALLLVRRRPNIGQTCYFLTTPCSLVLVHWHLSDSCYVSLLYEIDHIWFINKKAQLSLTNPRDAKACQNCSNSTCLQRCRWQYWPIFMRLTAIASEIREIPEIHWKFKLMEFKVIQGHWYWCQSKAHMWLAISH